MDTKANNEKLVEDSLGRYHHKIQALETDVKKLESKTDGVELSQKEVDRFLQSVGQQLQDLQKDRGLGSRVHLLEQKMNDEYLRGLIGMQLDFTLDSRFKILLSRHEDTEKKLSMLSDKLSTLVPQMDHLIEDSKKKGELSVQAGLSKLRSEFQFKLSESEKTYMASFNDIRKIVLQRISEIDQKSSQGTKRMEVIESSLIDVAQKYE